MTKTVKTALLAKMRKAAIKDIKGFVDDFDFDYQISGSEALCDKYGDDAMEKLYGESDRVLKRAFKKFKF